MTLENRNDAGGSLGKQIFRGTLIIIFVSILAKLSAFLSEAVNAAYMGTSKESDAYYMVAGIQQVLYPMLSIGIWKVFLPVYKDKITREGHSAAESLSNKMISFFSLVSLAAVVLLMLFSRQVVSVVATGFTGETKELCIDLVRISAPMYLFIVAEAIYAVMLQCHNKFFGSQIREVASHLPSILAAILLYRRFGIRVMALALVAGGILRLLIELPFVDWGYRYKPDFRFKGKEFGLMLKRLPSALLSEGVQQINALIDRSMASSFPEGAVSALNYGNRLCNVFSGLLSSAISTALFPQMVELISQKKHRELSGLMTKILNLFLLLMVPVTVACVLFSSDLVSAVYERGAFQAESTLLTSGVFTCYSIGLLFAASSAVVSNIFYGFGDTRTPLLISVFHMFVNVGLNLWLSRLIGVKGLALATSLSAVLTYGIRLFLMKKIVSPEWKSIMWTCIKTVLASAAACGAAYFAASLAGANVLLRLLVAAGTAVPLYLAAVIFLKVQAMSDLLALLRKKK